MLFDRCGVNTEVQVQINVVIEIIIKIRFLLQL